MLRAHRGLYQLSRKAVTQEQKSYLFPNVFRRDCQSPSLSFKRTQDLYKRKAKQRLGHGKLNLEDGDGVCAAYCVRNAVSISQVENAFRYSSFTAKKQQSDITFTSHQVRVFVGDVVHVSFQASENNTVHYGHAFIFQSGAVVFWGLPSDLTSQLLVKVSALEERVSPATLNNAKDEEKTFPFRMKDFDHEFKYTVDANLKEPSFRNDEIRLVHFTDPEHLLALSYGLAQSVKLHIFEEQVDSLVNRTMSLPDQLAQDGKIKLSHKELKSLIGELLAARYSVNLVSDILDTPDYFWQQANLERLHTECAREVELRQRARILDTRTEVIKDALSILNNELSSSSSDRVERAILFLIAVEVFLEVARLVPFVFHN